MSTFTRVRGFIPWNKVDIWLKGFRSIWVSTTRPDGRPHSVPVWYLWDGEHIYFTSSKDTQKTRNLAKYVDPHSGAQATLSEADNLYRVDVKRIMSWEYGVVAIRTDWKQDATWH